MKDWIFAIVVLLIITCLGGLLIKDAINKRNEFQKEIIEKVETSKNEIIDEVKSNGEKLDKLLEIASRKSAFENDK